MEALLNGFDSLVWKTDIAVGTAKAMDMKDQGIISPRDCDLIIAGLSLIKKDIEAGVDLSKPEDKDIHMLIDRVLAERIGRVGKLLHSTLCVS